MYFTNIYNLYIVYNRELKEVDHSKHHGSVLTRDGYCTREIKMRIVIAKEAFNTKMSLLTSKLNIGLKKRLVRRYAKHWTQEEIG
jgi:hypothetical protein